MDYKTVEAPTSVITRDVAEIGNKTNNIYEAIVICAKRADQINSDMRRQLYEKLEEFLSSNDTMEEIHENREQIEVSRFYEKLPKPSMLAIEELIHDQIYFEKGDKPATEPEEEL